jgi:hypothetical protein
MKCEVCGKEFEAKRSDARFCSSVCRKVANRLNVTDKSENVTDKSLSVTKSPLSVTKAQLSVTKPQDTLSVTKSKSTEFIGDAKTSKKESHISTEEETIYSPDYDMSEEGFRRRNLNWLDFSEKFRERIKSDVEKLHTRIKGDICRKSDLMDGLRVASK